MKKGQYYPGVMAKTEKELRRDLKIIDLVLELIDARIPASSRNQKLAGLIGSKKHLILLHKADRAEETLTKSWVRHFRDNNQMAMPFSVQSKDSLEQLLRFLKTEEERLKPTRYKRPLRMIIVGIPNVGKSTLINYFVRKTVARTGNQPGITRGRQWIRVTPGLELLDTPGILPPKLDDTTLWPLSVIGSLPAGSFDIQETALELIRFYVENGREELLISRYPDLHCGDVENIFHQIASVHGCLRSGGQIDSERTAALILRDFQSGKLGRVTLEYPPPTDKDS